MKRRVSRGLARRVRWGGVLNLVEWVRTQYSRHRAWNEARVEAYIHELMEREDGRWRAREAEAEYGRLVLTDDGFYRLKNGHQDRVVHWANLQAVRTFERDLFTHEMICVEFELAAQRVA